MAYQAKFHARAGSRSSLSSVVQMPIISEHGRAPLPSPPLRVPQKQARKNGGSGSDGGKSGGSVTPPPPYAAFTAPGGFNGAAGIHPPQPAVLHTDLKFTGDPEKMMLGDMKLDSPSEESHSEGEQDMSHWNKENRRRRCRFVGLVTFLVVIIIGLGIGLSLGLPESDSSNRESTEYGDASMTGTFSFNTVLHDRSTGCTSNPTTWRCYPFSGDVVNRVQWDISQTNSSTDGQDDDHYLISSISNASLAFPAFSNVPLRLIDSGLSSERFVFTLPFNKTVVPSAAALSSPAGSGGAASCTYTGTSLQATLFTRRSSLRRRDADSIATGAITADSNHDDDAVQRRQDAASAAPAWPGRVTISEFAESQKNSIVCRDSEGQEMAGMRAAEGTCRCVYTTPSSA